MYLVDLAFSPSEAESMAPQIDTRANECHPFALQQPALFQPCLARQQDAPPAAEHPLPGEPENRGIAQRPGNLSRASRMARGARDLTIGRNLAARYAAYGLADIVEVAHRPAYEANGVMSRPSAPEGFKPRCEVPQERRLMNDLVTRDRFLAGIHLQDDLDDVVNMALRVNPAREMMRDSKEFSEMLAKEPALSELPKDLPVLLFWNGANLLIR